jgi:hypothetical protein
MSDIIDFSPIAARLPTNPDKWSIIPIHSSDRATFKFCRRQWVWSSPSHLNLIKKASVLGIEKNLWFGTGIHKALERYYNPAIRDDPAIAFEAWFDLQWHGGIVSDTEVREFVDRDPRPIVHEIDGNVQSGNPTDIYKEWKVAGLVDVLPDGYRDDEMFMGLKELGINMMKFFKDYSEANDDFAVILVEHDFSVPVLNAKGEPLYAVDNRMMPDGWEPNFDEGNEFGPYIVEGFDDGEGNYTLTKQVHVRGRMDLIIQEHESGRYGIRDFKTASRIGDDYFRHLELDEQCTSYLGFGQLEARLHNLEFKELEFIDYQALLKSYPKPPTPLKDGTPSLGRSTETTTAKLFEEYIDNNGLRELFNLDPKMQNYYSWLLELGDDRFIKITRTWRNHSQRLNAMVRLHAEAQDMLNPNMVAYPNPTKNYSCLNCAFRIPCIQAETGDDYTMTLEDGYMPNWNR